MDRTDFNSTDWTSQRTYNGSSWRSTPGWAAPSLRRLDGRIDLVDTRCDAIESNQGRYAGTAAIAANNAPQPDRHWCDQGQLDLPWLPRMRASSSYRLPWTSRSTSRCRANGLPLFTRWNAVAHHAIRNELPRACRPGELVVPNMTLASYVLESTWSPGRLTTSGRPSWTWASVSCSVSASIRCRRRPTSSTSSTSSSYVEEPEHHVGLVTRATTATCLQPRPRASELGSIREARRPVPVRRSVVWGAIRTDASARSASTLRNSSHRSVPIRATWYCATPASLMASSSRQQRDGCGIGLEYQHFGRR